MLSGFINLFSPPAFDDPVKAAQSRNSHTILLGTLVLTFISLIYTIILQMPGQITVAAIVLVIEFGLLVLIQIRHIQLASAILTSLLWAALVLDIALGGSIRSISFGCFAAIILIAGLTISNRAGFIFAALSLIASGSLAFAENRGSLPAYNEVGTGPMLLWYGFELIVIALLFYLAIHSISFISRKVTGKAKAVEAANALIEASQADLKQRTSTLEKRNTTLQNVAAISRIANNVKSEEELLEQTANILIDQNKMENISIFVLDQVEENVILQVSCSQTGKPLAPAGTQLNVIRSESTNVLIGAHTLHFKIGVWNYYIDSPKSLPDMQTNLTFALVGNERLYGLLNIQDESPDPQEIGIETLQTVADQIALSMSNIRMLNELQSRVKEIGLLVGGTVRSAWEQLASGGMIGYTYNRLQVLAANETFPPEVAGQLLAGKSVSFISEETIPRARLAAPIKLRDNIIGVIGYDNDNVNHEWQEDEKVLLETVASRVSLALENTRLVAEAQQRAERERMIAQVTTRMRETLDIETILKTAVNEMRQSLALSGAEVRLELAEKSDPAEVSHE